MLFQKEYIIRRQTDGAFTDGFYRAKYHDFKMKLNIVPIKAAWLKITSRDNEMLPEGERKTFRVRGYGKEQVQAANQYGDLHCDKLFYEGRWYKCETTVKWDKGMPIDHYVSQWVILPEGEQERESEPNL
jgi:hypothetical protein